jgi:hypothetical protein
MKLKQLTKFIVLQERRVFSLTGHTPNCKESFFSVGIQTRRFQSKNIIFYSEVFDKNIRADILLQKMEQPLFSKGITIKKWVISIEKQINRENGLLCYKVFGRLLLSKPLQTYVTDFFSSEGYDVQYCGVNKKVSFEETLWSLATTQRNYNTLDSGANFACNELPVSIKVLLLWQFSILLFILGEFKRGGIQGSQKESVTNRCIHMMFWYLCTEANHNLNKWLSQTNPLHTGKGYSNSENQSTIYLLYIENQKELDSLRNVIREFNKRLKNLDS